MVGRKGLRDMFLRHHNEAATVGQAPIFVEAVTVQRPTVHAQALARRNDREDGHSPETIDKPHGLRPLSRRRECISNFQQHEFSRHQRHTLLTQCTHHPLCVGMERIVDVEKCQPGSRIDKNLVHSLMLSWACRISNGRVGGLNQ